MITPDKIYIPFYPNDGGIDTHLGDDWFDSKDIDQYVEGWKEYIHKDALISFLEKEKKDLFNWHFHDEDRKFKVYEEIINKIKEL